MLVDLVQTTARDGVRLDGALLTPAVPPALALDALCLVHGTGGNFYSSTLFDELAQPLLDLGIAILRVNTRGHDGISTAVTARGGKRAGAAYETLDDCRHDLAAWLDWLRQRVGPRVGLVGHSSGAVKSVYATAHEPTSTPACVIALSPPRLSYSWFCSNPEGGEFREAYSQAERLVEAGQGATLLEVRWPLPMVITAAGYVEKYGPDERYNVLPLARTLACPTLFTFGALEVANNLAFRSAPDELRTLAARNERLAVVTLPGADHFYTGVRAELSAALVSWLRARM